MAQKSLRHSEGNKETKGRGRPTVVTPEVVSKLELAFSYGCTTREACIYAGISHEAFYSFIQSNPDFADRRDELRLKPILAARQMIVKHLDKDLAHARWFVTKKLPKEFGDKLNVEHTVSHKVKLDLGNPEVREALNRLDSFARAALLKPHEPNETTEEPMEVE